MPDIQTYLDDILNAIYGEEVRGSIHDAIALMNNNLDLAINNAIRFKGDLGITSGGSTNLDVLHQESHKGIWRILPSITYNALPTLYDRNLAGYLIVIKFGSNVKQEIHYFSSSGANENIYWSRNYNGTIWNNWEKNVDKTLTKEGAAADAKALGDDLASQYVATKTYGVGEYALYNGQIYRCSTQITSPEDWTEEHWTAIKIADDLEYIKSSIETSNNFLSGGKWDIIQDAYITSGGVIEYIGEYDILIVNVENVLLIEKIETPNAGSIVYGFFTDKPSKGSVTYNESRTAIAGEVANSVVVPQSAKWIGIRFLKGSTPKLDNGIIWNREESPLESLIKDTLLERTNNLFNKYNYKETSLVPVSSSMTVADSGNTVRSIIFECTGSTPYHITRKNIGKAFYCGCCDTFPEKGTTITKYVSGTATSNMSFTTNTNTKYLLISFWRNGTEENDDGDTNEIKEELLEEFSITSAGAFYQSYQPYYKLREDMIGSDLFDNLIHINKILGCGYKKIEGATVNSSGVIAEDGTWDVYAYDLASRNSIDIKISEGGIVAAFYDDEPIVGSVSYNGSRFTNATSEMTEVGVPIGCKWIALRCPKEGTVTISPETVVQPQSGGSTSSYPRSSSYYIDPGQENFESDALHCAVSYLVHQANNTQIVGTPNSGAQLFRSQYASFSWRYLLSYEYAFVYQYKTRETYAGTSYPVYYSHCTPFALAITSCVPYEDSPWAYQFANPSVLGTEKCWELSQESGDYISKPYTYSWPNGFTSGPDIAFCIAKEGDGLINLAKKYDSTWHFIDEAFSELKTGDLLHITRSGIPYFAGHGHTMVYVKTIEEIKAAVEQYGCELVNWFGKDQYTGRYGYVIEITSQASNNEDYIRVSDVEHAINRANTNTGLYASYSISKSHNSAKAFRHCNNAGAMFFIHQPHTAICVNNESLVLNALPSKDNVTYQWQKSSDGETWQSISGATSSQHTEANPSVNYYYRCKVRDNVTGNDIYTRPVKCYKITVSEISKQVSSNTVTLSATVGGTSVESCTCRWEKADKIDDFFSTYSTDAQITLDASANAGKRFRYRVNFSEGYYCTTSVVI